MSTPATRSIAAQIIRTLFIVAIMSAIVTGGAITSIGFSSEMGQLRIGQRSLAELAAQKVSAYVDDLQRKLNYLARVRGFTDLDAEIRQRLLEGLISQNKAYKTVGFVDRFGRLRQYRSPSDEVPSKDWVDSPAFLHSYTLQEDFIGAAEAGALESAPTLLLSVPVRDSENLVAGMLYAHIDLEYLWAVLDEIHVGEKGYAYILDQRRLIVASSGAAREPYLQELSGRTPEEVPLIGPLQATGSYLGLRGTRVLGLSVRIETLNWRMVVETPIEEAYAPIYLMLGLTGACLAVCLVIAGLVGLKFGQGIADPLQKLTQTATRLRVGELDARVSIDSGNELQVLANAFNEMAERLSGSIVQLSSEIEERKQTELELRRSKDRLSEAQKLAKIGVWEWDIDKDRVIWTEELYRIAGIDPSVPAPTYAEHATLYVPESWEKLKVKVERTLDAAEPYDLDLQLLRPDGSIRKVHAIGGPLFDSEGRVEGLYGTVQDVTERLAIEGKHPEGAR